MSGSNMDDQNSLDMHAPWITASPVHSEGAETSEKNPIWQILKKQSRAPNNANRPSPQQFQNSNLSNQPATLNTRAPKSTTIPTAIPTEFPSPQDTTGLAPLQSVYNTPDLRNNNLKHLADDPSLDPSSKTLLDLDPSLPYPQNTEYEPSPPFSALDDALQLHPSQSYHPIPSIPSTSPLPKNPSPSLAERPTACPSTQVLIDPSLSPSLSNPLVQLPPALYVAAQLHDEPQQPKQDPSTLYPPYYTSLLPYTHTSPLLSSPLLSSPLPSPHKRPSRTHTHRVISNNGAGLDNPSIRRSRRTQHIDNTLEATSLTPKFHVEYEKGIHLRLGESGRRTLKTLVQNRMHQDAEFRSWVRQNYGRVKCLTVVQLLAVSYEAGLWDAAVALAQHFANTKGADLLRADPGLDESEELWYWGGGPCAGQGGLLMPGGGVGGYGMFGNGTGGYYYGGQGYGDGGYYGGYGGVGFGGRMGGYYGGEGYGGYDGGMMVYGGRYGYEGEDMNYFNGMNMGYGEVKEDEKNLVGNTISSASTNNVLEENVM